MDASELARTLASLEAGELRAHKAAAVLSALPPREAVLVLGQLIRRADRRNDPEAAALRAPSGRPRSPGCGDRGRSVRRGGGPLRGKGAVCTHAAGAELRSRPRGMDRSRDARANPRRAACPGANARPGPPLAARHRPGSHGREARPAEPALHRARGADGGLPPPAAPGSAGGDLPIAPLVVEPPGPPRARAESLQRPGAGLRRARAPDRAGLARGGRRSDDLQRRAGAGATAARGARWREGVKLLLLARGARFGLRRGCLLLRQRFLLRRDVDLVVPGHRPLEILDALPQRVAELRQLAGSEDEEDDDEDEQELAEPEIHRNASSRRGKLARRCCRRTSTRPDGLWSGPSAAHRPRLPRTPSPPSRWRSPRVRTESSSTRSAARPGK